MEHKESTPQPDVPAAESGYEPDGQLPTPPSEPEGTFSNNMSDFSPRILTRSTNPVPSLPSPPAEEDLPDYFGDTSHQLVSDSYDTFGPHTHGYTFSDEYRKSSPTSSNEVDGGDIPDLEEVGLENMWDPTYTGSGGFLDYQRAQWLPRSRRGSPSFSDEASGGSPLGSVGDWYDDLGDDRVATEGAVDDGRLDSDKSKMD